ncbi:MAG: DoxX family protein [Solirubrobacterales bacterium]
MTVAQRLLAAFFAFAGAMHFVVPRRYEAMMPPSFPAHRGSVFLSGLAEIAGGAALASPRTRPLARWWLLALLVAVFPANLHMAVNRDSIRGLERVPRWALWARLPLQPLMIWWVWRATAD